MNFLEAIFVPGISLHRQASRGLSVLYSNTVKQQYNWQSTLPDRQTHSPDLMLLYDALSRSAPSLLCLIQSLIPEKWDPRHNMEYCLDPTSCSTVHSQFKPHGWFMHVKKGYTIKVRASLSTLSSAKLWKQFGVSLWHITALQRTVVHQLLLPSAFCNALYSKFFYSTLWTAYFTGCCVERFCFSEWINLWINSA